MTKALHQSMFGFLSALLLALLFVITPAEEPEVAAFQAEVQDRFAQAASETFAGVDFAEPLAFIWTVTEDFYQTSAQETIALLQPTEAVTELVLAQDADYQLARNTYSAPQIARAQVEAPIYNIIPLPDDAERLLDPGYSDGLAYEGEADGQVLGDSTGLEESQVTPENPAPLVYKAVWMDINDSITGEPHCVAVFYGTVNTYPGRCAKDEPIPTIYAN